jgi:hypothetical protein
MARTILAHVPGIPTFRQSSPRERIDQKHRVTCGDSDARKALSENVGAPTKTLPFLPGQF